MNKILKFGKPYTLGLIKELLLVGLFTLGIGILNICNADNVDSLINLLYKGSINANNTSYTNVFNYGDNGAGTYCIKFTSTNAQTLSMGFANGGTTAPTNLYSLYNDQYGNRICLYGNKPYLNVKLNASSNTIDYEIFMLSGLLNTEIQNEATIHITDGTYINDLTVTSGQTVYVINQKIDEIQTYGNNIAFRMQACEECQECEQCQTCPTIDAQYCMNNFNLIPPAYCPICGTGDINWSSLYINGTQYNGNEIIDIHTEDQMQTNIDYLNDTVDIDISYGQDEEYIENIIAQEKVTPTNEDFEKLMYIIGEFIPYLFITLLIFFFVKIINKVRRR